MKSRFRFIAAMAASFLCAWGGLAIAKSAEPGQTGFTEADNEYYLTEHDLIFFQPGVEFELLDFQIPDDNQPWVRFSLTDPQGKALDRDGVETPGPIDVRMMLTFIPMGEENKVSYHDRFRDQGGEYTDEGGGVYTYKFSTVLPDDYDADATHTLAVVTTRDLRDYELERYYDNDVHNFVPSGSEMTTPPRDIVRTETCNRCHDPLAQHGGRYQEVQVCQQCHLPALYDEEEDISYSFNVMIHRVHAGEEHYPADLNDCEVCHTGGTPTADLPLVASPSPSPACDATGLGMTELSWADKGSIEVRIDSKDGPLFTASDGVGAAETGNWVNDATTFFLVSKETGEVLQEMPQHLTVFGCANNPPGTARGEAGALHTHWLTRPSSDVCEACHSDVDVENGVNHPIPATDEFCMFCHVPTGEEYDFSIQGAHQVDYKSAQLGGVLVNVLDIDNTGPGQRPVVTFSLSNKWGPLPPSFLGRLRFVLSGPNEDFSFYAREDVLEGLSASGSNWVYQFETALPSDAVGSYTLGFEGRINSWTLNEGSSKEFSMRDQAQNYTMAFSVTGDVISPRRMVVDDAKCENCHVNLSLHGSNRHDAGGYCQTCHRPDFVGGDDDSPQSVDFRYMIHKIHRGADLEYGYVVGNDDFSDIHFPGDLRNCESCHMEDTYKLPLQAGLLYVATPSDPITEMGPTTAACLSCHDSDAAAVHASTNSNELGEACAACHGEGKQFAVEKIHAR